LKWQQGILFAFRTEKGNGAMINCDVFGNCPVAKEAIEIWTKECKEKFLHFDAPYAEVDNRKIHESLAAIYESVGAKSDDQFFFFSSEEEAMENVYSHVLFDHMFETGKHHILSLDSEGSSTLSLLKRFEKAGCSYQLVSADMLSNAMSPRVGLVTLTWAHPVTGAILPLYEIAELCKKNKVLLHVRITEALGRVFFRYQDLPVDFITFSGSSFYLPPGSGALFAKKGSSIAQFLEPISKSIGKQNTPISLPSLITMGEMAKIMIDQMETGLLEMARLRSEFEEELKLKIPEVLCLNEDQRRLPNVSVMAFPYIAAEALAFELAERGIYISIGGARSQTLDHLLIKSGIDPFVARSSVSFGFTHQVAETEIKKVVGMIHVIIEKYTSMTRGLRG